MPRNTRYPLPAHLEKYDYWNALEEWMRKGNSAEHRSASIRLGTFLGSVVFVVTLQWDDWSFATRDNRHPKFMKMGFQHHHPECAVEQILWHFGKENNDDPKPVEPSSFPLLQNDDGPCRLASPPGLDQDDYDDGARPPHPR